MSFCVYFQKKMPQNITSACANCKYRENTRTEKEEEDTTSLFTEKKNLHRVEDLSDDKTIKYLENHASDQKFSPGRGSKFPPFELAQIHFSNAPRTLKIGQLQPFR